MKQYYPYLDQMKGLAILLMVMAHTLSWSCPDYSSLSGSLRGMTPEVFNTAVILKIIYSFHMHLLFFVSGFLFYKVNVKYDAATIKMQLRKRASRLLIPYITTGIFVYYLRGYFGYWFFMVLFVLNIVVLCELYFINKVQFSLIVEHISHTITFVILFVACRLLKDDFPKEIPQLSRLSAYYLVFMFGYSIHKYKDLELFIKEPMTHLISIIAYITLMIIGNYYNVMGVLSILIPIFAISFLYVFFTTTDIKVLGGGGKCSMEIYIFHLFFVMAIPEVGAYIMKQSNFPLSISIQLTYSLIVSAIAIFFSMVCGKLVKSNRYISKLVLGV